MEQETLNKAESVREGRIQKLTELVEMGINPYPYNFDKTASAQTLQKKYADIEAGTETEDTYSVAGRIMSMRNSGMFIDLMDASGKIQIFSHKENLPEEKMKLVKLLDVGDMIGVTGTIRRTPRGELTIKTRDIKILAKSLQQLPEKFHGLTDKETRYRQRYLDMIMNQEVRDTFVKRSKIIKEIREYLTNLDQVFADHKIDLIGNESQTVGPLEAPAQVHYELLAKEVVLLEGIRLDGVKEGVYLLNAAPINLGGSVGAPCRAVLIEE